MLATTTMLLAAVQAAPDRIELAPARLSLDPGESAVVQARALGQDGAVLSGVAFSWHVLVPEVVAVDANGRVTALSPGEARVAARAGNTMGFAIVEVRASPAAALSATLPDLPLPAGASAPVAVVATDSDGERVNAGALEFASTNEQVATVDALGRVFARAPGEAEVVVTAGRLQAEARVQVSGEAAEAGSAVLAPAGARARTGDVVRFRATIGGRALRPAWSVDGAGAQIEPDEAEGVFVAERPGAYRVTALVGESQALSAVVRVDPRSVPAEFVQVGRGAAADHHSGDTWVFEGADGRDYAYVGTYMHDWMKAWDVTDPSAPALTDSVRLDARRINDVKIHGSARLAVVTREGASDRRNGIVVLDLADPARPTVLSEYKSTVTGGVHNVWIEDDLVYAVHNGTRDIHIIDISDPEAPEEVGRWGMPESPGKSLHDVIVQEGYAYLSYWDDGVVMLDVGAGTHGGTPTEPQFVSRYKYPAGNTHTAWRAGRYLFVGDEIFPADWDADRPIEARGYVHVLDMEDPERPVEVARYEVPEAGAHNIWVEGDRLYVGYYQAGLRVVDISGELRGDLYAQGRELAVFKTIDGESTVPNWGMTWGAQVHKGNVFTSDLNSGLWIVKLVEASRTIS